MQSGKSGVKQHGVAGEFERSVEQLVDHLIFDCIIRRQILLETAQRRSVKTHFVGKQRIHQIHAGRRLHIDFDTIYIAIAVFSKIGHDHIHAFATTDKIDLS